MQALKEMQIPGKIVRLVNTLTQHTKAKNKLNTEYTEQIDVTTGIKQGDPLSTRLFSSVMEMLMRKLQIRECNKTDGKAKSKMGRRCEEWFEEDGGE